MKLFYNANIITQEQGNPRLSAMAIDGEEIVAVGESKELLAAYPQAEQFDLQGKTIVPGFIDAHIHLLNYAYSLTKIDCHDVGSIKEMIRVSRAYIKQHAIPAGKWVQGRGWSQIYFEENRNPTVDDLDAISTEHPLVYTRNCEHVVVANSLAMQMAGITVDTPHPVGGEIEKDERGLLTGVLKETARYLIYEMIPQKSVAEIKEMLQNAIAIASSCGVTTMHSDDFETFSDKDWRKVLQAYRELEAEGKLNARIYEQCLLPSIDRLQEFIAEEVSTRRSTKQVQVGPLKLLTDGSLGGRSAYLAEPYSDDPENRGIAVFIQSELNELVTTAHKAKMGVVCHAIGDAAITMCLDAFAHAQTVRPDDDARFGIIHLQIMTKEHHRRFLDQKVIAYMEPITVSSDLHLAESRVGKDRLSTSYAYRTLCDMGVQYNISSDCPVDSINPFDNMYVATNRCDYTGYPAEGWYPAEKLTAEQVLRGFTANGAYASFEEHKKGTIAAGKLADFVILSTDPTTIDTKSLREVKVLATYLGGRKVYEKGVV